MESLFGDAAESRSVLGSGLGAEAEQLLSIKNSFCQTWLSTARHEAGAAASIGIGKDVVQSAAITADKAESRHDHNHPHSGFDTGQGGSEGASYGDDAFEVEPSIASDNYNDEEFEEGGGSIASPARESPDAIAGSFWTTAGRKETPPSTMPGARRPPVQGQFAPGSLLVFMVDAGSLGNLRRLKLEARVRRSWLELKPHHSKIVVSFAAFLLAGFASAGCHGCGSRQTIQRCADQCLWSPPGRCR